jgi:hypothetical protein
MMKDIKKHTDLKKIKSARLIPYIHMALNYYRCEELKRCRCEDDGDGTTVQRWWLIQHLDIILPQAPTNEHLKQQYQKILSCMRQNNQSRYIVCVIGVAKRVRNVMQSSTFIEHQTFVKKKIGVRRA